MNTAAIAQLLDTISHRITYAIDSQDYGLLRFTMGELEDLVHNMKIDLTEIKHEAITEDQITAHLQFMGKSDE